MSEALPKALSGHKKAEDPLPAQEAGKGIFQGARMPGSGKGTTLFLLTAFLQQKQRQQIHQQATDGEQRTTYPK